MTIRIGAAQINSTVGDITGNKNKILDFLKRARGSQADIVSFPELALTGYPPEDLLLKTAFIKDNLKALRDLARQVKDIVAIVGFVDLKKGALYNAAAVLSGGRIQGICHKQLLPNYGVFDEKRYFTAGVEPVLFHLNGVTFGVSICEDIWFRTGPTNVLARMGTGLIFNINASPYHVGKITLREEAVRERIRESSLTVCYTNLVGGQDELVFDGQSFIMNREGVVVARALPFKEDLLMADIPVVTIKRGRRAPARSGTQVFLSAPSLPKSKDPIPETEVHSLGPAAEIYEALKLGLHDYVVKNGFKKTVIGLSGGIDSALVAVLAADALGSGNVTCVFMPSRYTSRESFEDAEELADNLSLEFLEVPIDDVYRSYIGTLGAHFRGLKEDITEENLQARIRGNLLMALSNKFGWLVLTTGNKSEMSVGYATLYGDMAGGFAVIKDVPKTVVYELSVYRNGLSAAIPERILTKEPTAELKPDQKDRDTLPPYEHLDPILRAYVEEDKEIDEIAGPPMTMEEIKRVLRMVDLSEYKRRQSPPGIKITPKAFGRDRRMPITNKYRGGR